MSADERTVAGIDASRRVGWAKFFEAQEDRDRAIELAMAAYVDTIRMSLAVQHHDRLAADDPLVVKSMAFIGRVESTPWGRRLVERIRQERQS